MFTESQKTKIIQNWGRDTLLKVERDIEAYSDRWKLSDLSFVEHYSMNVIFTCESGIYGACVLKIGGNTQDDEFVWERNVLNEYGGRRFVRLYDSDIAIEAGKKIMLLERVSPGTILRAEPSLKKRLAAFTDLYAGMHKKPANAAIYKKYADGIADCEEYVGRRADCVALYAHAIEAKKTYSELAGLYSREMLLHGDLHSDNILLGSSGTYVAVDPQGRVGDPVFDIPRYVMMEYYHYINTIPDYKTDKSASLERRAAFVNKVINILGAGVGVPAEILRKCFYVEIVIYECWSASVGDYDIHNPDFAKMISD